MSCVLLVNPIKVINRMIIACAVLIISLSVLFPSDSVAGIQSRPVLEGYQINKYLFPKGEALGKFFCETDIFWGGLGSGIALKFGYIEYGGGSAYGHQGAKIWCIVPATGELLSGSSWRFTWLRTCPVGMQISPYFFDPTTSTPQICTPNDDIGNFYIDVKNNGCVKDTCAVGNPINPGTGNKHQTETDYIGVGIFPIIFQRTYNSVETMQSGIVGRRWRHSYERKVYHDDLLRPENKRACEAVDYYTYTIKGWVPRCEIQSSPVLTTATVSRPDGKMIYFVLDANGIGHPDSDVEATLVKTDSGWQYTSENNEIETYDANGLLRSITSPSGLVHTLYYNTLGELQTVSDSFGRSLTFAYDINGRLSTVTGPGGSTYVYSYDVESNLSSVTHPDAKVRTYLYENTGYPNVDLPNALTGIVDENGSRFATWAYDVYGRAILSEHAGGVEKETVVYNDNGTAVVTDAAGTSRTYGFVTTMGVVKQGTITQPCIGQFCGGVVSVTSRNTYDANGNRDLFTDFNGTTTDYDYDLTRNLETRRIEAKGTPQQRTITTQWHPTYRLPTQIAAPLKRTTYSYDANGQLTSKTEQATTDANGSLGLATTATGTPRVWSYSYNAKRQIATVDGPRTDLNDTTRYVYDPVNGNLQTITNALNHTTQITHHDASGRPLRLVDANGLVTQLRYTPRGWTDLIKVGTDTVYETTDLDYDGVGQLIKATLPDGSYLSYSYDAAHRLTDIRDAQGNQIHYTLDLMSNRTATAVKDPSGTLKRIHTNVYNTLNRLSQSIGADKGPDTQTTYYDEYDNNGNLKKMRDAQGNITQYGYDAFNRLATTLDALNGTTSYGYDAQGNLSTVTDARGNTTRYSYDGLGNLTQLNSPDTGTTNYTAYDGTGNLLSQTDAKGQTTQYQYDALNRLTRITYADNSTTVYSYDQGNSSLGRLSAVNDANGSVTYQYDQHGRITNKTQTSGTISLPVVYRYNSAGQLDQVTYPSGAVIGYSYSSGKLNAISRNGQPLLGNIRHDPFGPVSGWSWGSNSTLDVSRQYDLDGQLTSYTLANATQQLSYATTGNLTAITETGNPANNSSYGYDALYRLTNASGPQGTQGYSYDANGNRSSATLNGTTNSYTLAATNNRLQSISGVNAKSYAHDANGNLINDGLHNYSYDARNRLTAVDATISYTLNGLGQRTRKTAPGINTSNTTAGDANGDGAINAQDHSAILNHILGTPASNNADCNQDGQVNVQDLVCINIKINPSLQTAGTTHFVYDEQGQLIGEYDQNGAPIQETLYLGNLPIAVIKQGNVYRLYADHLNTPRAITDSNNTTLWSWESDAFGTTAANEDADGDGVRLTYNLRFPGQYFDQETGLHYNYFRYYDPLTGRYTTSDPIGLAGGLNLYAYVENDPINNIDPTGESRINIIQKLIPKAKPKAPPKPSPKFKPPTNLPANPPDPTTLPPGIRCYRGKPTEQYPNGYWKIEKFDGQGWQRLNPQTMKPGPHQDTHVPMPPGYKGPFD